MGSCAAADEPLPSVFHPFQYQVIDTEFMFLLGILAFSFISHRVVLFFVGWLEEKQKKLLSPVSLTQTS